MLLILLDPLTAIAYGAIMVLLFKLFFLVLVPLSLLLAIWSRLSRQGDREPSEPRVIPPTTDAGSGQWYLLALGLAMCFAVGMFAVALARWS